MKKIHSSFVPDKRALDVEAAIAELDSWGTQRDPSNVSPELRVALIQLLRGRIKKKTGPKALNEHAVRVKLAADSARHKATGTAWHPDPENVPVVIDVDVTLKDATENEAARFGVTKHASEAALHPRTRQRKT